MKIFNRTRDLRLPLLVMPLLLLAAPPLIAQSSARFIPVPDLPGGGRIGAVIGISADGSAAAGHSDSANSEGFRFGSGREAYHFALATGVQTPLGDVAGVPAGEFGSFATGISGNGAVITGVSFPQGNSRAWRWSASTGMQMLPALPGGITTTPARLSESGEHLVGYGGSSQGEQAIWWSTAQTVGLGDLPGGSFASRALAIAENATVIVGQGTSGAGTEAFRWTPAGGMASLGDLPGGAVDARATAVSADGSVVAGTGMTAGGPEAFRWTAGGGMQALGKLPGDNTSTVFGMSRDGSAVFGQSTGALLRGFIWTAGGGMQDLGMLPGGAQVEPRAATPDLSVIVGVVRFAAGGFTGFVWTRGGGMQDVADVLRANGLGSQIEGYGLLAVNAVSADGRVIGGEAGTNPGGGTQGWLAEIAQQQQSGELSVDTTRIVFKKTKVGASRTAPLVFRNTGDGPLSVRITANDPFFVVGSDQVTLDPGETHLATISFRPSVKGRVDAFITVSTVEPEPVSVQVPVSGKAKGGRRRP